MEAQAVVFRDRNVVSWQSVSVPDPGPKDVVVQIEHSWISNGTEGSFLRGERTGGDTPYEPGHPWPFPQVPGYQKTGVITWVGPDVEDLVIGERVFATVSRVSGCVSTMGGHVSPAVTPCEQIWKLPPGLTGEAASGLVLAQVGYNCGTQAPVGLDDVAIVIGDGLVGHWSAQTLAWQGAQVIMLGHHPERLAMLDLPASTTLDTSGNDPVQTLGSVLRDPISIVVDTVGTVSLLENLLPLMRRGGHIVSAGFCGTQGRIDIQRLRLNEISLHCPSGWTRPRMDATLTLLQRGVLDTTSLITHRFPAEHVARAWDVIRSKDHVLGVILQWLS